MQMLWTDDRDGKIWRVINNRAGRVDPVELVHLRQPPDAPWRERYTQPNPTGRSVSDLDDAELKTLVDAARLQAAAAKELEA
jgi:hypothetical protein